VHDLDPEQLRALAPEMPFELVEEVVFLGNADDVAERLSGYAANGMNHVVMANLTGVVGGMEEIEANMMQFIQLKGMLDAM
jgi:phthiodiolone/phenolphthiodiolone dimycocerosates ketoreductase